MDFNNFLKTLSFHDLKILWNEYAATIDGGEKISDSIQDFADNSFVDAGELARMVFFGNVVNWDDNVFVNDKGNFQSCFDLESSPINIEVLAEWLEEENHEAFTYWKTSKVENNDE